MKLKQLVKIKVQLEEQEQMLEHTLENLKEDTHEYRWIDMAMLQNATIMGIINDNIKSKV